MFFHMKAPFFFQKKKTVENRKAQMVPKTTKMSQLKSNSLASVTCTTTSPQK